MPIAALSSTITPTLPAIAGRASTPLSTAPPSALAAARFKAMMGADPSATVSGVGAAQSAAATFAGSGTPAPAVVAGASPLGDRILHGLGVRVSEVSQRWHDLAARTRGMSGSSDPTAYMQAQMDLLNLSVSTELVSKVSGRVVQNIDALVKNP